MADFNNNLPAVTEVAPEDFQVEDYLPVDAEGKPKYVPEGWDSAQAYLIHAIETYDADALYDRDNRQWALEDLEFLAGEQWDPEVKRMREDRMRPCLTINVLPQFIGQVIGDRRINKTTIKVRPLRDGTMKIAEVRSGLIKSIELYSRAERAYDAACEDQVACGISNLRVDLDYAGNDVFDQDLFVRHIPNPLSVIWDRMSIDPTGRDARHCFVTDSIPKKVYEKQFPDYPCPTGFTDDAMRNTGWLDSNNVRITEFWELVDKPAKFAMMQDGDIKDVTGMDPSEYQADLFIDERTGEPVMRDSFRTYARMHLVTSWAILTKAYELPLRRLPIIRVEGRVTRVGDQRIRYGLVRNAKDSQRLKNYWRSVAAETLALAPKAQWIAEAKSVEGREKAFREAHLTGDPLLTFNDNTAEPKRVDPPAVPAALLQEAQMNQQDIKDTTGLQDASLGIRSNEVSGKAIDARRRAGDVATAVYHDNLNHAIQEVGDVLDQLIPIAYDALRTIRVVGVDDKHTLMTINDPNDVNSPNITQGKYDVILETGPSFSTQRAEAMDAMMTLLQTAPEMMGVIGDLVAKNMDWPGAYEIAERIKKTIPKELLETEDDAAEGEEAEPTEEQIAEQQAMAQQQQMAEAQMQMQMRMAEIELEQAEADLLIKQESTRAAKADADAAEAKAREADAKAVTAEITADYAPQVNEEKLAASKRAAQQPAGNPNGSPGSRPAGDRGKPATQPKKAPKK